MDHTDSNQPGMTGNGGDDAPAATSKDKDRAASSNLPDTGDVLLAHSETIARPRQELYDFWRDFGNLPQVMDVVERVDVLDRQRSHWVVKAPGGRHVEWDSRIIEDIPGEVIAWTSEDGADVPNSGRISFRDAGARGTVVTATLRYDPPAGVVGRLIAKLFQREPRIEARRELRRFKQLMETGEIATSARNRRELAEKEG